MPHPGAHVAAQAQRPATSPPPGGFAAAQAQWLAHEAHIRDGQQRLLVWVATHTPAHVRLTREGDWEIVDLI